MPESSRILSASQGGRHGNRQSKSQSQNHSQRKGQGPGQNENAGTDLLVAKVPEITALFWVIKLVTTFMGEATSDYLGNGNVAVGAVVEVGLVVAAVWIQFRTTRYVAAAYWFLAMAIAVFGTGASDALHTVLGIPYGGTTALWAVILAGIFWRWYRTEGTLSIHSVTTRRREVYYWSTVFATFALGTAVGDFTAGVLNLGFLASGFIFTGLIMVPAVARWGFRLNAIAAFWFAYVLTRPLGASFADYASKPHSLSGANLGDAPTSAVSAVVLFVLVAYVTVTRKDVQEPVERGTVSEDTSALSGLTSRSG